MAEDIIYRVRVRVPENELLPLHEASFSPSPNLKENWLLSLSKIVWMKERRSNVLIARPWDFVLNLNGMVDSLPVTQRSDETNGQYPPAYRLPLSTLSIDTPIEEKLYRQERFAFGSLCYEIVRESAPYTNLPGLVIQSQFAVGEFPDDVKLLPDALFVSVLAFWSLEFARTMGLDDEMEALVRSQPGRFEALYGNVAAYAARNPVRFSLQALGGVTAITCFAAPAMLGVVGFGALGPVAGSIAAGWQSSIGAVQAGSFFAACQSLAMGGTVAETVSAAGMVGLGVAGAAAFTGGDDEKNGVDKEEVWDKFREVYKKVD
ncbi:hypothetical protein K470DRAFT_244239 [Piedraia hortae CBS 480.64]|uniref:Uncharacterized protein n=1 Tax=Piedraia hortae CBS 480.64 TaxID=1314780 RepID=A0A6A7C5W1_9PEZI|nr:hypothetical protein K470DRAFT_244239 [Piedraia hortae CBS 480.64]